MQKSLVKLLKIKTLILFFWHSQFVFSFLLSYFKYERFSDHNVPENQRFFNILGIKVLNLILGQLDFSEKKICRLLFLIFNHLLRYPKTTLRYCSGKGSVLLYLIFFILFAQSFALSCLINTLWSAL